MPKITLKYEGEVNTLDISDKDTNRLGIEKLI